MSKGLYEFLLTDFQRHETNPTMKFLSAILMFISVVVECSTGYAATSGATNSYVPCALELITGTIRKANGAFYLESQTSCRHYTIMSMNPETYDTLQKLTSGDAITASGQYDDEKCTVSFANIEYVGLKKFLGKWTSKDGIFEVHDFRSMTFYPSVELMKELEIQQAGAARIPRQNPDFVLIEPIQYQYSVTSFIENSWVMFLSDQQSTAFTTISFEGNKVTLQLYDSENGSVKKVLVLTKKGSN